MKSVVKKSSRLASQLVLAVQKFRADFVSIGVHSWFPNICSNSGIRIKIYLVLEVRNAILQRAFHLRRSVSSGERRDIARERDTALTRLERLIARGTLLDAMLDMDPAIAGAAKLSAAHTEHLGARAIDLLHVASALILESELFLTTDARQAQLAKAEGLKIVSAGRRLRK